MDPRALGLADGLLHHVDEGGHVVVGDPLPLGHRLTKAASTVGALARHTSAASAGTSPTSTHPSVASSSTRSHMPKRASSEKRAAIASGA